MSRLVVAAVLIASCNFEHAPKDKGHDEGSANLAEMMNGSAMLEHAKANHDSALVAEAQQWVKDADPKLRQLTVDASLAEWANETDITKEHEAAAAKANEAMSVGITNMVKEARKFEPVAAKLNPDTRRQLLLLRFQANPSPDDPKLATELAQIGEQMTSIYGKGVCTTPKDGGKETCKNVDPFSEALQTTRDPAALRTWQTWHDGVGHAERDLFVRYVELGTRAPRRSASPTSARSGARLRHDPRGPSRPTQERLWEQVKPLYERAALLRARASCAQKYGKDKVPEHGPIPAQLLGNMWAQEWDNIYDLVEPYPGEPSLDVDAELEDEEATTPRRW